MDRTFAQGPLQDGCLTTDPLLSIPPGESPPSTDRAISAPMPVTLAPDVSLGIVRVSLTGKVTLDDLRRARVNLDRHPDYRPTMHLLTDIRGLSELPSMTELQSFAHVAAAARRREHESVRRGVIVGSTAAYGVARQYITFLMLNNVEADVLAGDPEAELWIAGLPQLEA
jgi:hypothetical protein